MIECEEVKRFGANWRMFEKAFWDHFSIQPLNMNLKNRSKVKKYSLKIRQPWMNRVDVSHIYQSRLW